MPKIVTLKVADLEVCDRVRVRYTKPKKNSDVVQEYAEAYECHLITEPLDVFQEKGTERYIVADGENRLLALRRAKIEEVECRLHSGDEIAALDFAIGCNQAHGLRRTKADKYHAFERIMDTELRDKYRTDTELSEKVGVSISTIKRYKADWRASAGGDRKGKRQAKDRAAKHDPTEGRTEHVNDMLPPKNEKESRASEEKVSGPKLTKEQKAANKAVRDKLNADKLNAGNRKTVVEAIDGIRSIPHDGATAAKKGWDLDEAHVRYVLEWCQEYLAAKEKAAA